MLTWAKLHNVSWISAAGLPKPANYSRKNTEPNFYLLEGEKSSSAGTRLGKYGEVDNFSFYLPVNNLRDAWEAQGMTYTYVNGAAPNVPSDVKFDLVYSWLSCGFHYPINTYRDFIKSHTTPESIIIMDVRLKFYHQLLTPDYTVVKILESNAKKHTVHFRIN